MSGVPALCDLCLDVPTLARHVRVAEVFEASPGVRVAKAHVSLHDGHPQRLDVYVVNEHATLSDAGTTWSTSRQRLSAFVSTWLTRERLDGCIKSIMHPGDHTTDCRVPVSDT